MSTAFVFGLVVVLLIFVAVIRFRAARPLSKPRAFGIAAGLYVLTSVLLAMGMNAESAEPNALFWWALAFAAYGILRIGASRRETGVEEESEDPSTSP